MQFEKNKKQNKESGICLSLLHVCRFCISHQNEDTGRKCIDLLQNDTVPWLHNLCTSNVAVTVPCIS